MTLNYKQLAELGPGERPYKRYFLKLQRGYFRVMASKLVKDGYVVSINYYGKMDNEGKILEINRVIDKKETITEFEEELEKFRTGVESSGLHIDIAEIKGTTH